MLTPVLTPLPALAASLTTSPAPISPAPAGTPAPAALAATAAPGAETASGSDTQLVVAAVVGIAVIVVLITWLRLHPFLSLILGSVTMAVAAGVPLADSFTSFTEGLGSTVGDVGVLIALGAVIGTFLIESGGADRIVDTVLERARVPLLPWAMALTAFVIGIPLFFEVGVVLLIPIVMLVARRCALPVILVGIPALAGLSALHGLVPPHPGPLIAIDAVGADLGLTLGLGLVVAVPTVVVSGPLAARYMARWVPLQAGSPPGGQQEETERLRRPTFAVSLSIVLLPVVLMLLRTVVETTAADAQDSPLYTAATFLGTPVVALLVTTVLGLVLLGRLQGDSAQEVSDRVGASLGPVAGILLIVGAGGGFKQTLVDSGVADVMAQAIQGASLSPLLAGWLVAVAVRLATGSATVATVTASGIMAPVAAGMDASTTALLVLALGAGSVFLSHVNDAGFWLVKEYFGMSVGQTLRTWSLMECLVSVVALATVMLLSLVL
ncbi:gluconate transporter [Actinomyces lilanjuaniae]|uniref:Gluconate transporter n=1 Tax=Actinomyces lilanjuaniae TaxID=2321394 RepID=A0ABN5PQD0_9ACTO|nr:gluconate:H+ symporter [Actinomyces lilanjuaniae]AYD90610.1 gluconate transporter [Actinomyces lilanjuaniae]